MPKVGKREQKILNKLARKKLSDIKKDIESGEITIPDQPVYGMIPKYTDPKELGTLINDYIVESTSNSRPLTIAGLALKLGIEPYQIRNYEKKDQFTGIFQTFKLTILKDIEERMLVDPKMLNSFRYYLENNYAKDYQTKTTQDVNITGSISLVQLNREADKLINATIIEGEVVG